MDQFVRAISGALKAAINAHGPIAEGQIPSAAKRIAGELREPMKQERDRMMTTKPRAGELERLISKIETLEDENAALRYRLEGARLEGAKLVPDAKIDGE